MGCASSSMPSASGVYDLATLRSEIQPMIAQLPRAELQQGRVIRIQGATGFFNPAGLLSDEWTEGRFTSAEWSAIVADINDAACRAMVGMTRSYTPDQIPRRAAVVDAALTSYVQEKYAYLQRDRGVKLEYVVGQTETTTVGQCQPQTDGPRDIACRTLVRPSTCADLLLVTWCVCWCAGAQAIVRRRPCSTCISTRSSRARACQRPARRPMRRRPTRRSRLRHQRTSR